MRWSRVWFDIVICSLSRSSLAEPFLCFDTHAWIWIHSSADGNTFSHSQTISFSIQSRAQCYWIGVLVCNSLYILLLYRISDYWVQTLYKAVWATTWWRCDPICSVIPFFVCRESLIWYNYLLSEFLNICTPMDMFIMSLFGTTLLLKI